MKAQTKILLHHSCSTQVCLYNTVSKHLAGPKNDKFRFPEKIFML